MADPTMAENKSRALFSVIYFLSFFICFELPFEAWA